MIMSISISLFVLHLAVLYKMHLTNSRALEYEEVLETERKLLELQSSRETLITVILALLVLVIAAVRGLVKNPTVSAVLPCISLLTAVVLHLMDFRSSLSGMKMWRSPQLQATECTSLSSKALSTTKGPVPLKLSRRRNGRLQLVRLLTWLLATGALTLLILIVLDGLKMRGELIDYSFTRGHITTPPHALAHQNTLLLHKDVDSLPFTFSTGPFTSKVKLRLEHPLLNSSEAENVTIFDGNSTDGGEYSISVPAGPLYSRLIVDAASHLHQKPTRYVIHLIRTGEARCHSKLRGCNNVEAMCSLSLGHRCLNHLWKQSRLRVQDSDSVDSWPCRLSKYL